MFQLIIITLVSLFTLTTVTYGQTAAVSPETQECIGCHSSVSPGIVADWKRSRHASITPAEALKKTDLQRRVSNAQIPKEYVDYVVGCAECHKMNPADHKDTFDHNDAKVHVTVTPKDCATCHPEEVEQYNDNIMSRARNNLKKNPVFSSMADSINGTQRFANMKTTITPPNEKTEADSCFHCHGTQIEVKGTVKRDTDFGEMEFPVLSGWPNQGVGRINTDGSEGLCSSCHSKHRFSLTLARKADTCSQCHKGPDVPAYKAYSVSKHGNIYASLGGEWNFKEVPWTIGKDFNAPTCAVCHVSLLVTENGDVVAKRTHRMNDRLPWRILGLPYAHPHPKSPDTSIIRNKDGMPLPTALSGEPASQFLISAEEQEKRRITMTTVCMSCHSKNWVNGQWARFENTIHTSNEATKTATDIMLTAWKTNMVDNGSLFDDVLEKMWVQDWLFYGNSTRVASAMMGADYGVFAEGRWFSTKNIQEMVEHLKTLNFQSPQAPPRKK